MHEKFRKTIEECFETKRPSEFQTGKSMLISDKPILREDTGYIKYLYSDIRPIYMPPIAK